jgi:F-type H+-transporting ATPase subunit b
VEALGINLNFLIAQIVNFLLLMFILRMVLYRPMLNMLETRREKIRESLSAAEKARAEAANRSRENEEIIAQARRQAQDIIRQAEERARQREQQIVAEAGANVEAMKVKAQQEVEYERQQAMAGLRGEVAQLSLAIARKTIGASLVNEQAHARIVDEVLSGANGQ